MATDNKKFSYSKHIARQHSCQIFGQLRVAGSVVDPVKHCTLI